MNEKITKAWKGFDKDFKCRDYQYEVGNEYELSDAPVICQNGFHACLTPVDVLAYYPAKSARYAEVDLIGDIVTHGEDQQSDSKIAASKIRIVREISYFELWQAQRKWMSEREFEASATGDMGHASATGKNSISASLGMKGKAKASAGQWIVLAAYGPYEKGFPLLLVKTAKCGDSDGEVRPDVWHMLDAETGEFVECEED